MSCRVQRENQKGKGMGGGGVRLQESPQERGVKKSSLAGVNDRTGKKP